MLAIDTHELAWAAGFFDGEGHVGVHGQQKGYRYLRINIPQIDPRPLRRFQAAVGIGKVYDPTPTPSRPSHHSPQWTYRVGGFEKGQAVIAMLWGYLSGPKRDQARAALAQTRPSTVHRLPSSLEAIRALPYECKRGHKDDVFVYRKPNGKPYRMCRQCALAFSRDRKRRLRAERRAS